MQYGPSRRPCPRHLSMPLPCRRHGHTRVPVSAALSEWLFISTAHALIHAGRQQLEQNAITLFQLWQEYRAAHPQGYQFSWFSEQNRAWQGKLDVVIRQHHRVGDKLFVDYVGQTLPVIDRATVEAREAQIFVVVLGDPDSTYAEATWSRSLPHSTSSSSAPRMTARLGSFRLDDAGVMKYIVLL